MDIAKALEFAVIKHADQKRKNGDPYILHPIQIADNLYKKGFSDEVVITGLFHDLLEDTDTTEEEILELSNKNVLEAVILLTKTPENKISYLEDLLQNDIAKVVKNEDRICNLKDAVTADPSFEKRYLKDTEKYLGRFSSELDEAYRNLQNVVENSEYTTDAGVFGGVLYRTYEDKAWEFDFTSNTWIECDPCFWCELEDDAVSVSTEEAINMIQNKGRN